MNQETPFSLFLCFVPSFLVVVWSKFAPVGPCRGADGEDQPPPLPLCPPLEAQILQNQLQIMEWKEGCTNRMQVYIFSDI